MTKLWKLGANDEVAQAADLPYALVVPAYGWSFSGSGVQVGHVYDVSVVQYESYWAYSLIDNGDVISVAEMGTSDTTVDFFYSGTPAVSITATQTSGIRNLLDRAVNAVSVTGDTTLTLPAAVAGKARDFLVRLEISGSAVPTITFAAPTGETITYETEDGEFPVPDAAGTWLYAFSEVAYGVFAVALKSVSTATQGGAA